MHSVDHLPSLDGVAGGELRFPFRQAGNVDKATPRTESPQSFYEESSAAAAHIEYRLHELFRVQPEDLRL